MLGSLLIGTVGVTQADVGVDAKELNLVEDDKMLGHEDCTID